MRNPKQFLTASEAARQLGTSTKALRLYEERGLIKPLRTSAGWRSYGTSEMERLTEILDLRALGLSLAQIERVLGGDRNTLEAALAAHEAEIDARMLRLSETRARVRALRSEMSRGSAPAPSALAALVRADRRTAVSFPLPWPWGGELFELRDIARLNYITGPLFSGKTRFAHAIAEHLPDTALIGLERRAPALGQPPQRTDTDAAVRQRVERTLEWLVDEGAASCPALLALLVAIESLQNRSVVIDMVEQGLDEATQRALVEHWRRPTPDARTLFLLTRSNVILDLASVGPDAAIFYCPANHSPPFRVLPYPGAAGYEAVSTCVAAPEVRARTEGVVAVRRPPAS